MIRLDSKTIGGLVVAAGVFYYFQRNARTPSAMINEAAKDVKSTINVAASSANKVVDIGAGGASAAAETATKVVDSATKIIK